MMEEHDLDRLRQTVLEQFPHFAQHSDNGLSIGADGELMPSASSEGLQTTDYSQPFSLNETVDSVPRTVGGSDTSDPAPSSFELTRLLGRGGMGEVWEARQPDLDRVIAVKRLRNHRADQQELHSFLTEALVTAELQHPNIVPVHVRETDEKGQPLIGMKLVQGLNWRQLLHPEKIKAPEVKEQAIASSRSMALVDHLEILLAVADAIRFAHSRHILHRDLKPDNIMVGEFGEVVVMDWGLALDLRSPDEAQKAPSVDEVVVPSGTPCYMAPEQARAPHSKLSAKTDQYLLGAILYEILTGVPPHQGSSVLETVLVAAKGEVEQPSQRAPDRKIPESLSNVAMKAMAPAPTDRYDNLHSFQQAIRDFLTGEEKRKEALDCLNRATAILEKDADYPALGESTGLLQKASGLWPEHQAIQEKLVEAQVAYVRMAVAKGDLSLASSQLAELQVLCGASSVTIELNEEVNRAIQDRRRQRRRFRLVAGSTAALLLIVAGLAPFSWAQWNKAEENLSTANAQRKQAEDNLRTAQQERDRAQRISYVSTMRLLSNEMRAEGSSRYNKITQLNEWLSEIPPKLRSWDWGYYHHLLHCSQSTLKIESAVGPMELSADGRWLFVGAPSAELQIWNLRTRKKVLSIPHVNQVRKIMVSPTQDSVVSWAHFRGSPDQEEEVCLWKLTLPDKDGAPVLNLIKKFPAYTPSRYSSDGKRFLLLTPAHRYPEVVEVATGNNIVPFPEGLAQRGTFELNNELDQAVALTKKGVGLWDLKANQQMALFPRETSKLEGALFSADEKHIVIHNPIEMELLDRKGRSLTKWFAERRLTNPIHVDKAESQVLVCRRTIGAEQKYTVMLHERKTGKASLTFIAIAQHLDRERILFQREDFSIELWDVKDLKLLKTFKDFLGKVDQFLFTRDQSRLIAVSDALKSIAVWDVKTGKKQLSLALPVNGRALVALTEDERQLLATWPMDARGTIYSWDLEPATRPVFPRRRVEPRQPRFMRGHQDYVKALLPLPEGGWVSGSYDGTVRIWQDKNPVQWEHAERNARPYRLTFQPKGEMLASSGLVLSNVAVLDCKTGKKTQGFKGENAVFHPQTPLIASSLREKNGWKIQLRDTANARITRTFPYQGQALRALGFSPNGNLLAGAGGNSQSIYIPGINRKSKPGEIALWDLAADGQVAFWNAHQAAVLDLAFSTNGKILASCAGGHQVNDEGKIIGHWGEVKLWDVATLKEVHAFDGHTKQVNQITFSPDGTKLGTASNDGTAKIWDVETRKELFELKGHRGAVNTIAFSPDGKRVVTGGDEGFLRIWETEEGRQIVAIPHSVPVLRAVFSPNGIWLAAAVGDLRPLSPKNRVIVRKAIGLEK